VNVQLLGRFGWRTQHSVSTGAAGTAQTRVRMASNRTVRGRYAGDTGLLPSSSAPVAIGVRPQVTVSVGTRSATPGDPIRVTGSVAPRKTRGVLSVKRQTRSGGLALVSRRTVALRSGRLRTTLRMRRPALYRVRLSVRRDPRNLAARSAAVAFRVR
jgi:hypothetical protein